MLRNFVCPECNKTFTRSYYLTDHMKVRTPKSTPLYHSVADPGCLSRILIFTHSGSRIQDPGSKNSNKREGVKKKFVILLFVATNFTKLKIILFLKCGRKKNWAYFQRIIEVVTQKIVTKLSKYGFGTKRHRIQDPGSRIQQGWQ